VVRHANRFTEKGRSGDADCARAALLEWINAGALSDLASHTDVFKLSTTLSGLTAAYLQIRPAVPDKDRATIEAWFVNRAVAIRDHVETEAGPRSRANNHRYWSGAAVALAGLAADRTDLVEWGFGSYELGVCSADRDGALPLEVARGKRARDYHLYALAPLVVLAEIGTANGRQSYAICRNALARIIDFSLQSIINPEAIEKLAAQPQFAFADGKDLPSAKNLVFLEAYLKRFPEALKQHKLIERALPGLRPFRMTELGGSMTLLVLGPPKAPDTGVETEMQSGTE
jgi:poly(beta-D-mannuronate) lyase